MINIGNFSIFKLKIQCKMFSRIIANKFGYWSIAITPFTIIEKGRGGSTDVGDISWVVPTAGLRTATWVPGTSAHTWQAVAAGGMSIGHKGMMLAAKTLAATAIELFNSPKVIEAGKMELKNRVGKDFVYKPLLGDRKPPLDYRM